MSDSSLIQSFLDTETTGIGAGHRIVEIGVVQVIDREVTSERFHVYLNPERKVDEKAYAVHGLSDQFLADQRPFKEISEALITCIRDTELCIHNADFDVGFLDAEWTRLGVPTRAKQLCQITDTLAMARTLYPGQRNSLDALCKRFGIDLSHRTLHGALLDAELLAQVYLAMTSGQKELFRGATHQIKAGIKQAHHADNQYTWHPVNVMQSECVAHEKIIERLAK